MDNKLSELSKPVDFLKSAALITAREFERWSKLAALTSESSSVLHSTKLIETSQLLSALLAELEAKDKTLELEREKSRRVMSENHQQAERIADLEVYNAKLRDWNAGLAQESCELQAKLATPVRLPELCGDGENDNEYTEGLNDGINQSAKAIRSAGFTVEGDE